MGWRKKTVIISVLIVIVVLIFSNRKGGKTEEVMNSENEYANTIPPRTISGVIEEININEMKMNLQILTSQLDQIHESEPLVLDFTKTVIDHDSDNPTNPTNESRKKELEKYSTGQRIYVRLRTDIPVKNNVVYIENPADIY